MAQYRSIALLAILSILMGLSSCREIPTAVKVGRGPSFLLTGSGRLATFTVYAPQNGEKIAFPDRDVSSIVWQITASEGYFKGQHEQGLQLIYGKVPDGYQQLVPNKSQAVPPLDTNEVYSFLAETTDAPIATGYFYMQMSGPIQTNIPDLCIMFVQGHKVRVKCKLNSSEPYQEPADLEKYVRDHQTTQ